MQIMITKWPKSSPKHFPSLHGVMIYTNYLRVIDVHTHAGSLEDGSENWLQRHYRETILHLVIIRIHLFVYIGHWLWAGEQVLHHVEI